MHRMARDLDPADPDREAVLSFRLLSFSALQLRYLVDRQLSADGLTTRQAGLLSFVALTDSAPSLSDAAFALGSSHQNAKKIVEALITKGYLSLEPDATDGRVKRLEFTARGRAHWERVEKPDHALVAEVFGVLSADEQRRLRRLLTKLEASATARARTERGRG